MFSTIVRQEREHLNKDKLNCSYHIGICKYMPYDNYILLLSTISALSFLKYTFKDVYRYLKVISLIMTNTPKVHIMQLIIQPNGIYTVVLKTYWIRLIQRHWKKTYKLRCEKNKEIKNSPNIIYKLSLSKQRKNPYSLLGLLSFYSNVIKYKN